MGCMFTKNSQNSFYDISWQRLGTTFKLSNCQRNSFWIPYSSPTNHALAVIYPIADLIKPIYALVRILEGAVLLVGSLFISSPQNKPSEIVMGIGFELLTIISDIVTAVEAILNLISRSLTTLFHLGYDASSEVKFETSIGILVHTKSIKSQNLDDDIRDCSLNMMG